MSKELLKKYLYYQWLRPESALADTVIASKLQNLDIDFDLDFGCGNGAYTFLFSGGSFVDEFDMFYDVKEPDKLYLKKEDIYNRKITSIKDFVKQKSIRKIQHGCDIKFNSIYNASLLNLYDNLNVLSGNTVLPYHNNSFKCIFTNILYWLDDINLIFSEFNRILRKGGKAVICFPTKRFKEYLTII